MKKLLFLALVALVALPAFAQPLIGLYADEQPTNENCDAAVVPYTPLNVYVVATWMVGEVGAGITAAEFKIDNLPVGPGYPTGTVTVTHSTDLVIGDLYGDYSAAWAEPQGDGGTQFTICSIEFLAFDAAWIGADVAMTVAPGDDCLCLVLVDDLFEIIDSTGGTFTFNCSGECDCGTATEATSWSAVKALF